MLAPLFEGLFFALFSILHNNNYNTKPHPERQFFSLTIFRNIKKYLTKSFVILNRFKKWTNLIFIT